jgi:hypothetical protein
MHTTIQEKLLAAAEKQKERLAADREAKMLKAEEEALIADALAAMAAAGLTTVKLANISAEIKEKQKPYISDFTALEGYIVEHGALDLLQKRLTENAVKLRWEDGIAIPGVGVVTEQKLNLRY